MGYDNLEAYRGPYLNVQYGSSGSVDPGQTGETDAALEASSRPIRRKTHNDR